MAEGDEDKDKIIADLRKEEAGLRRKLRDTEAELAQVKAKEGDQDKIVAAAKAEGAAEAKATLDAEHAKALAGAELRAVAAKTLADPDDAVRFLDLTEVVGADGKVDRAKIDQQLAELVEKKPYLAATGGGGGGDGGAGANGAGGKPTGSGDGGPRPPAAGSADDQVNALLRKAAGRS